MIQDLFQRTFYGNSVLDYVIFAGAMLLGFAAIAILRRVVLSRLKRWSERTNSTLDDFLVSLLERAAVPLLYYGVFYAAVRSLNLHPIVGRIVDVAGAFLMTFIGVRAISEALVYVIRTRWTRRGDAPACSRPGSRAHSAPGQRCAGR